jgi:hypothetical protein
VIQFDDALHHLNHIAAAYRGQVTVLRNDQAGGFIAMVEMTDNQLLNLNPLSHFAPFMQTLRQRLLTTNPHITAEELDAQQYAMPHGGRLLKLFLRIRPDSQMPH